MKLKSVIILILFVISTTIVLAGETAIKSSFETSGAVKVKIDKPKVSIFFNKAIKIWMLQLKTPSDYKKKHGAAYISTLFFSRNFTPGVGEFPIKFSYLNKENTLGGSFIVSGKKRNMFSFDTEGKITFTKFDDIIEGSYQLTTYDGSKADRQQVSVKGSFSLPRGDAFKEK
jgi:hypothetical protein